MDTNENELFDSFKENSEELMNLNLPLDNLNLILNTEPLNKNVIENSTPNQHFFKDPNKNTKQTLINTMLETNNIVKEIRDNLLVEKGFRDALNIDLMSIMQQLQNDIQQERQTTDALRNKKIYAKAKKCKTYEQLLDRFGTHGIQIIEHPTDEKDFILFCNFIALKCD